MIVLQVYRHVPFVLRSTVLSLILLNATATCRFQEETAIIYEEGLYVGKLILLSFMEGYETPIGTTF
jgi:hypothetical protein